MDQSISPIERYIFDRAQCSNGHDNVFGELVWSEVFTLQCSCRITDTAHATGYHCY